MKQNNKKINKITITVIIILLLIQCSGNIKKEENKNNIEDNINNNILKKEENKNNIEDNINNNILKKEENKNNIKENIIKNSIEKINNVVKDSKGKEKKVPKGFENIKDEEETYIKVIIDKKNKGFIKAIIDESKISIVDIDIFKNNNINIEKNKKYKFKFKNENFKFKYVALNETLIINTIENTNEGKILIDQQKNNFNVHQNLNTNLNKSDEFSYGLGGRLTLNNNDYSVKTLWYKKDNDFFVNDLYLNKEFKNQKIKSGYFNVYSNSNYFSMDNRILGFELNEKSKNMNIIELNIEEESVVTIYRGDNELIYKK